MGEKNKTYSKEFKIMVVTDYLSGISGGTEQIAKKYNIPTAYMVSRWIRKYQNNGPDSLGENRGKTKGIRKGRPKKNMSDKEKIKYLEAENAYLREIVKERENILKKRNNYKTFFSIFSIITS